MRTVVKQIEYLQETNRTLEEKVKGLQQKREDASTEVANLSLKNRELCEELTHIDDLAKRLEMDKERVLETADTELQEARVGLTVTERGWGLKRQKRFTLRLCLLTERTSEAAEDDRGPGGHHHQGQKGLQNLFVP